ncbi:swr1p complex component [Colletotrichum kahawae]|uniref:SWR1-complex protein 5 n=1 Tax=Colletotrichum kahawae TaxID=34407 RepID=A0AAD9YQ81_COLKA|nr:swr1p complex component [Colletotrichum kahawae]
MPPDPTIDDEEYESSQDSDFAPEDGPAAGGGAESEAEDSSDSDSETANTSKRKRDAAAGDEADDAVFENSGDEALIKKAKKKRKKARGGDGAPDGDDEGGEGGLVKTRSMRAAEKVERKMAAATGPVTVDVDALWAQMLAGQTTSQPSQEQGAGEAEATAQPSGATEAQKKTDATDAESSDMIRIKRTYNFAGKVQTEEKLVARDSAEAKLYLASLGKDAPADEATEPEEPKKVLKKAFRSAFEPTIEIVGQRSDLNLGMTVRIKAREKQAQAKKLNTVEKSKMDWAGYVDKEGLKDELELAGRSKESYAGRQDFLARSEAKREEEARRARISGRV